MLCSKVPNESLLHKVVEMVKKLAEVFINFYYPHLNSIPRLFPFIRLDQMKVETYLCPYFILFSLIIFIMSCHKGNANLSIMVVSGNFDEG